MNGIAHSRLSRRSFCLCCVGGATFAATGAWLTPAQVFAAATTIVDQIRAQAAKAIHQDAQAARQCQHAGGLGRQYRRARRR